MKRLFLSILLVASAFQLEVHASQLTKIIRSDSKDLVQLYFSFDKLPEFKATSDNRRVDLVFANTILSPAPTLFPPDEEIVKILPRPDKNDLIVSLFFRYKPQHFSLKKSADDKIVLVILLGNEYSKTYKELSERLKGISEVEKISTDFSNPVIQSPYKKDWMSFFSNYESPVTIDVPLKFTPPPFPIIRFLPPGKKANLKVLPDDAMQLFEKGSSGRLDEKILELLQQTQDNETKKLLALSLGETLLHKGDFDGAYRQLYVLKEQYKEELLGTYANFLLIHLRAKYQDANIAEYEYQNLETTLGKNSPLAPYLYLGQIEAALASKKLNHLNTLLQRDDIALPDIIQELVQIRRADYWNATKQPIKAFASYQLLNTSKILPTLPYSLSGYCGSFYEQKMYQDAVQCYDQLSSVVPDKSLVGIISYRKNMAKMKLEERFNLINEFSLIESSYSGTEAGFRAGMKKADLQYLQNKGFAKQALEKYKTISEDSPLRIIREEAFFKMALVHSQLGDSAQSIELLQQFLREFLAGDVRISAQALLIELLPGEIKRHVDRKEYIKALVLAKKNKDLFQKSWINSKFLIDIAEAYHNVGLFDEAQKLYLYLIEIMPLDQREWLYLPMIKATFNQGSYSLVEDYSSQYFFNYPKGEHYREILLFRLQSLIADERLEEALRLLPSPLPDDKELYDIAAILYFRTDDFEKSLDILKKLAANQTPLPQKQQFMLAESLFQQGALEDAEAAYLHVTEENTFYEQSLFRLASLERKKGNEQKALSLFKKIAETGKNAHWKKYAERELQFDTLSRRQKNNR